MAVIWGLLLCAVLLSAVFLRSRRESGRDREAAHVRQQETLRTERTELYELLLYAQKKYRETGEENYLSDIEDVQARIAEYEKSLRQTVPED